MDYIIDIQGFRKSNSFAIKELAIVPVFDNAINLSTNYLFEPPCKWSKLLSKEQSINKWLEIHFHKIPWKSGFIPYDRVVKVLQHNLRDCKRIYVKGSEKLQWLQEIIPDKWIYDLEDMRCPSIRKLEKLNISCANHLNSNAVCAVENAYALKKWLLHRLNYSNTNDGKDEVDL